MLERPALLAPETSSIYVTHLFILSWYVSHHQFHYLNRIRGEFPCSTKLLQYYTVPEVAESYQNPVSCLSPLFLLALVLPWIILVPVFMKVLHLCVWTRSCICQYLKYFNNYWGSSGSSKVTEYALLIRRLLLNFIQSFFLTHMYILSSSFALISNYVENNWHRSTGFIITISLILYVRNCNFLNEVSTCATVTIYPLKTCQMLSSLDKWETQSVPAPTSIPGKIILWKESKLWNCQSKYIF